MQRSRLLHSDLQDTGLQVDPVARQLWRDDAVVPLQPLTFSLLRYLIEHPGRVLDKDELHREVWQTRFISDSALPRAIMKLRAALGDTGAARPLISTVQRAGYRFDGRVVQEDDAAGEAVPGAGTDMATRLRLRLSRLAVLVPELPMHGTPPDTGPAGFAAALARLLGLLDGVGLLPGGVAHIADGAAPSDLDPAALCRTLDATTALICQLPDDGPPAGPPRLVLRWGDAEGPVSTRTVQASSWQALAGEVACAVTGRDEPRLLAASVDETCQAQLAELLTAERQGLAVSALALLGQLPGAPPDSGELALLRGRLLRICGRLDDAEACIVDALQRLTGPREALAGRLLTELAEIRFSANDKARAEAACDEAMHLLARHAPDGPGAIQAMLIAARMATLRGEHSHAVIISGSAVAKAVPVGDLGLYLQAVLLDALCRTYVDDLDGVRQLLGEADQAAAAAGLIGPQCDVKIRLSLLADRILDRTSVARHSIESARLASRTGDARREDRAWLNVAMAYVDLAELDRAGEVLAERLPPMLARTPQLAAYMQYAKMLYLWRAGDPDGALALARELLDAEARQATPTVMRLHVLLHLLLFHLGAGRLAQAQDLLNSLPPDMPPELRMFAQAHVALAGGDRARSIIVLQSAQQKYAEATTISEDMLLCLAWLLLEDGELREDSPLWCRLRDLPPDYPNARLLQNLMALARGDTIPAERWHADAARAPGIVRRHRWLLDIGQARALLRRVRPPLGELLYLACL